MDRSGAEILNDIGRIVLKSILHLFVSCAIDINFNEIPNQEVHNSMKCWRSSFRYHAGLDSFRCCGHSRFIQESDFRFRCLRFVGRPQNVKFPSILSTRGSREILHISERHGIQTDQNNFATHKESIPHGVPRAVFAMSEFGRRSPLTSHDLPQRELR
jgi:hypothetical protein